MHNSRSRATKIEVVDRPHEPRAETRAHFSKQSQFKSRKANPSVSSTNGTLLKTKPVRYILLFLSAYLSALFSARHPRVKDDAIRPTTALQYVRSSNRKEKQRSMNPTYNSNVQTQKNTIPVSSKTTHQISCVIVRHAVSFLWQKPCPGRRAGRNGSASLTCNPSTRNSIPDYTVQNESASRQPVPEDSPACGI